MCVLFGFQILNRFIHINFLHKNKMTNRIKQETIDKINEILGKNKCTDWKLDEEDTRYVKYICNCGNSGRNLKQTIFRTNWKGCAECSVKTISQDCYNRVKEVLNKNCYELISIEKGRKVSYKCEHDVFSTSTPNIIRKNTNWKGSCSKCKFREEREQEVLPIVEEIIDQTEIILEKGKWYGGKSLGSITETNSSFKVQFKSTDAQTKSFNKNRYGLEQAKGFSEKYRVEESKRAGLTKNCIRDVKVISHPILETSYIYKEVMLSDDKFTMIENDCLELIVQNNINLYITTDRNTCYANIYSNIHKKLLHSVLYPEFSEVDHIDRNGLNNLRYNVRDGGGRVNSTNRSIQKNNTSGIKGVRFEGGSKARWKASWVDKETNKRVCKSFSIAKYGEEKAKQLAINARIENAPNAEDLS